jgi:hypothetical protein
MFDFRIRTYDLANVRTRTYTHTIPHACPYLLVHLSHPPLGRYAILIPICQDDYSTQEPLSVLGNVELVAGRS